MLLILNMNFWCFTLQSSNVKLALRFLCAYVIMYDFGSMAEVILGCGQTSPPLPVLQGSTWSKSHILSSPVALPWLPHERWVSLASDSLYREVSRQVSRPVLLPRVYTVVVLLIAEFHSLMIWRLPHCCSLNLQVKLPGGQRKGLSLAPPCSEGPVVINARARREVSPVFGPVLITHSCLLSISTVKMIQVPTSCGFYKD